jgi:hypothetical protein
MRRFGRDGLIFAATLFLSVPSAAGKNPAPVDYMLHCQGCHLPGGIGHPGIVPSLRNHVGLFLQSREGRAFLIQVPGVAQSSLDDADLAAVMNWMLLEFDPVHVKPDFEKFTAAEVRRYRYVPINKLSERRRNLLSN